jgi:2-polyprenyl-3-methyl-5-hydroxy-6-metoxy-1,4-benzoquinol methylase
MSRSVRPDYAEIVVSLPRHLAEFFGISVEEVRERMEHARDERNRIWMETAPKSDSERERLYSSLGHLDVFKYAAWHRTDREKQKMHNEAVAVALSADARVLDCGGGIGDTALLFAMNGLFVTYVDLPGICYDFARFRWLEFDCVDRITVVSPSEMRNLEAGGYGVVMSIDVLEHLDNPVRHAFSYRDVLQPGGHLFITTHFRHSRVNPDHLPENNAYYRIFGGERKTTRRSILGNLGFRRRRWYHYVRK